MTHYSSTIPFSDGDTLTAIRYGQVLEKFSLQTAIFTFFTVLFNVV